MPERNLFAPPNPAAFNRQVWEVARRIPYGKVATYGKIGEQIPAPEGVAAEEYAAYRARWVGAAMARCPADVPWQRVINAQGKLSPRQGVYPTRQKELLEAEGVAFDAKGKVDLGQFGWDGK